MLKVHSLEHQNMVWWCDGKEGPCVDVPWAVVLARMHFHRWTEVLRPGSSSMIPPYETNMWDRRRVLMRFWKFLRDGFGWGRRGETGNWRLKRIMKNVSALYFFFWVSLVDLGNQQRSYACIWWEENETTFTALELPFLNTWQKKIIKSNLSWHKFRKRRNRNRFRIDQRMPKKSGLAAKATSLLVV